MSVPPATASSVGRAGLRAAPWVLWFGLLGGAVAWSLHTVVDWGIDETTCRSGHTDVAGIPLRPLLAGIAALFTLLSLVAMAVAYRQYRRLRDAEGDDELEELRLRRAGFMALIGIGANFLFAVMLVLSLIDVFVFPVCGP